MSSSSRHRVHFDADAYEVYEITPYSEIYGLHPRDFVFGMGYEVIPAINHIAIDVLAASRSERSQNEILDDEFLGDDEDSDIEDEDGGGHLHPNLSVL